MPPEPGNGSRPSLRFRAVNRFGAPDYQPGLQRHHLLPRQLLIHRSLGRLIAAVGQDRIGFDDFRRNGLLLPASDNAAVRLGLPLRRGPHRDYNAMVFERVGQIEARWAQVRFRAPEVALIEALERLRLLQSALRRRLLSERRQLQLNRRDPQRRAADFAVLDAMAAQLWLQTAT